MGKKLIELLERSVIVQGTLTVGVTASVIVMLFKQLPVPEMLWGLLGISWGFYFGTKSQMEVNHQARRIRE
jgi:hypothetical protein